MQDQDRQAIDGLFARLGEVSRQAPTRDPEAEAEIEARMRRQPGCAYYMAQTIVAQEQALAEAQRRLEALEARPPAQEGLLSRLFGGSTPPARAPARPPQAPAAQGGAWGAPARGPAAQQGAWGPAAAPRSGGGFLAGAAQTAVGVAGGMMMAHMLTDMLAGDQSADMAAAEDPGAESWQQASHEEPPADVGGFEEFDEI